MKVNKDKIKYQLASSELHIERFLRYSKISNGISSFSLELCLLLGKSPSGEKEEVPFDIFELVQINDEIYE
jgi:hypothetical protein